MKKITKEIEKLNAELIENKGIMPESWKPFAKFLVALLRIAEIFTNDKMDIIIENIITAIEAAE